MKRTFLTACSAAILSLVCALPAAHAGNDHDRDHRGGHDDRNHHDNDRDGFRIETLSSAPHLVSGGSVLVRIEVPRRESASHAKVRLNGSNVTSAFHADAGGRSLTGLVQGLRDGKNELEVFAHGRSADDRVKITNWPITGPIISGPHQTPFICQTEAFTLPNGTRLGAPLDDDCSINPVVTYMYLPTGATALLPLPSTTQLPADIATATTLRNVTVPFVVRVETRTVNRGIYQSAVLHDPTTEAAPSPHKPPKGWNRRLIAIEGFGCPGGWYIQGAANGNLALAGFDFTLLSLARLREGYAMFANTLQHASNNCNAVLASEATMMGKEHSSRRSACRRSPSAPADRAARTELAGRGRIPGLFDGILIMSTFPDPLSIALGGLRRASADALLRRSANPSGFTRRAESRGQRLQERGRIHGCGQPVQRTDPVPDASTCLATSRAVQRGGSVGSCATTRSPIRRACAGRSSMRRGTSTASIQDRLRAPPVRQRRRAVRTEGAERRRHHAGAVPRTE